jgi:hypothetical protein
VQLAHQRLVDWRGGEVELGQCPGQREACFAHAVGRRTGLVVGKLGAQQFADHLLQGMPPLGRLADDLVVGGAHAGQLQRAHRLQDLLAFHQTSSAIWRSRS